MNGSFRCVEICAGAGGQALGLHQAGFSHDIAVEIDADAVATLRANHPEWNPQLLDARDFDASAYYGADLYAGGVPCPPFSVAGKQLGRDDERDLFPVALDHIAAIQPKAVLLENVKGLAQKRFQPYRDEIAQALHDLGYVVFWQMLQAADFGVPQLRPRFILVALQPEFAPYFKFPEPTNTRVTVGEALEDLMGENGWQGASQWAENADSVAPTLVGGSKRHGGPDVGPTRAKQAWKLLGVKGSSIADNAPAADFPTDPEEELPRLTVRMGAVIQGFPADWQWQGKKTSQWRQVGNAFPPPVAKALGERIIAALNKQELLAGDIAPQPYQVASPLALFT